MQSSTIRRPTTRRNPRTCSRILNDAELSRFEVSVKRINDMKKQPINTSPTVVELNVIAVEKGGAFYYSHKDERYRFRRGNELHTFASASDARPWLTALPAPVVYQGDGETLPGIVRR